MKGRARNDEMRPNNSWILDSISNESDDEKIKKILVRSQDLVIKAVRKVVKGDYY